MNKESQQLLRDSNIKPTANMIDDCLGTTNDIILLAQFRKENI